MAEELERQERPVLTGLAALLGVGLVVGLILGGIALAATQVLGVGDEESSGTSTEGASLYLPKPSRTAPETDPAITLEPGADTGSAPPTESPTETETETTDDISLQAGQTEVAPLERIDLTGVYPGGEGAILQVERLAGGTWTEFRVTASVSGETFSTYIQTGQTGPNKFRVRDTDTDKVSNVVTVTVG